MPHRLTSRKRAATFSAAVFALGIVILVLTNEWWPGIMLPIGLALALRQYLMGRTYDMVISLLVFVGTFATVEYNVSWEVLLPVLFTLGAIYVFFREMIEISAEPEAEREDDLNHEIEEKSDKK